MSRSDRAKIAAKYASVESAALGEKTKAKPGMVASKRLAVTYIMT